MSQGREGHIASLGSRPVLFSGESERIYRLKEEAQLLIMAIFTGKGFTKDMYDRLRKEVNWETDRIDGWIVHSVRFDESGDLHMINIWESREKMSEAFASRLGPVMRKIGIPPPQAEVFPAYNVNVFKTTD